MGIYKTVALVLTFATWTQRWSQKHEDIDSMKTSIEQQWVTVKIKQEPKSQPEKKSITNSNEMEQLGFTPAVAILSGSLSLEIVSVILLIHMVGVDVLTSFYEVVPQLCYFGSIIWMLFGVVFKYTSNKCKMSEQQRSSEDEQQVNKQLSETLNKVKEHLENQKKNLAQKLREVEFKMHINKEELQNVEKKMTEKDTSDSKNDLLEQKERLLQLQWKLDEEKKGYERQFLNTEKSLEPIENG
ncbi:uncharacterized protein LOC119796105 [Cyprinodon tularosa]|uniref:uncharacterized protein LOC119796105 n=1 Tax=Cyprinodon tularosa TaxID=77115 RepID=UPI0018E26C20|nr:uncharacterized protein LOC119796105 [Cyprinodon tularosa]